MGGFISSASLDSRSFDAEFNASNLPTSMQSAYDLMYFSSKNATNLTKLFQAAARASQSPPPTPPATASASSGNSAVALAGANDLSIPTATTAVLAVKASQSTSGSSSSAPKQARSYNKMFMDEMRRIILADKNHPLRFLLDPKTGDWLSRAKYSPFPTVQAGHLKSLWGLGKKELQSLAIEDSTFNQLTSNVAESGNKAIVEKSAIQIGGVFVEQRTAEMWKRLGYIKTVPSKPSTGWIAPSQ